MSPPTNPERYLQHCVPADLISHDVSLYYRFNLNDRGVKKLLFECETEVSHETICQ